MKHYLRIELSSAITAMIFQNFFAIVKLIQFSISKRQNPLGNKAISIV